VADQQVQITIVQIAEAVTATIDGLDHSLALTVTSPDEAVNLELFDGKKGDAGDDGREVELQNSGTYVQWRYVGDATWINLIALSALVGPPGDDGTDGTDGQEIELQVSATHIQWRYVGAPTWTNLIALSAITGPGGDDGTDGTDGREVELQSSVTHVQWRYVGDPSWTNLVALSTITGPGGDDGADGRDIELQNSGTHIQWRYVGDPSWTNLVALSTITGPPGDDGSDGLSAYQVAVNSGFVGDEAAWLASLHGADGADGEVIWNIDGAGPGSIPAPGMTIDGGSP